MGSMSYFINVDINVINSIVFQIPKHNKLTSLNYATPKIVFTYNGTMEFIYEQTNVVTPLTYGLLFLMNYQFIRDLHYNKVDYLRIMSLFNIRFESTKRILTAKNIMHTVITKGARNDYNHITYEFPGINDHIELSAIYSIPYSIEYITND